MLLHLPQRLMGSEWIGGDREGGEEMSCIWYQMQSGLLQGSRLHCPVSLLAHG